MQGNMNFETFSEETLQVDEVKIEEHEDLNDTIYNNNVSNFFYVRGSFPFGGT